MTAPSLPPLPPLPEGLRDRVLSATRAARTAGRPVPAVPPITSVEAFERAADAFTGLLAALDPAQWAVPVLRNLDVQGLVGHLTGVESDVQRALTGDPDVADADHVDSTEEHAATQAGRDPAATRAEWRAAVDRTLSMLPTARRHDGAVLSLHGMRLTADALMVVRAFELWTHENDVRRALGLPASVPDPSTLTLMTKLAVRLLPHAVARCDAVASPLNLHLVLTGAGGGTWDLPLGGPSSAGPADDVVLVVDAVDFCRLVANRVAPDALDVHVDGDEDDAGRVLEAAATLALD